jgi:hypothetical protein
MRNTKRVFTIFFAVLGVALIVVGVRGGVWPLSVQLIAGVAALTYAIARWRLL